MTDRPSPTRQARWFESAWRRVVIDMHIPDWDPRFFSRLDADRCIEAFAKARVQSAVFYAQSHVGLFNYPTRVGRAHAGLGGRDLVAEMQERCRAKGIAFVIYVSLVFDRYAYDAHPEWRGMDPLGCDKFEFGAKGRYGLLCPNSPYREYVRAWVEELCGRYDFDGIRFDMTYWPGVCVCGHCRARWEREVGGEIPGTVDWTDPRWVLFQRKREEWLADFASVATGTVRRLRPRASVEHQASTFPATWMFGVSHPLVPQNDFLEGDFYGSALQGSFARKLLGELTPNRPFCYETSASVDLRDHTGRKPEALLEVKASAAIADHAAFLYIDAIDPVGTVNPVAHERMGRVWGRLEKYYPELGGDRVADIAIYYSLDSKFDMRDNGKPVAEAQPRDTHTPSAMNVASRLGSAHLPFTVITAAQLGRLGRFKVLVLPNVHHLSPAEAAAIRDYVRAGGCLYASCGTSLVTTGGRRMDDFQLADVFGAGLVRADWSDRVHFLAPTEEGRGEFAGWTRGQPPILRGPGFEVRAAPGASVLATTTLPWPAPEPTQFSSIHSDPPWEETPNPEVVLNRFGKGRCIYCASPLEDAPGLAEGFVALIRRLHGGFAFEADAPAWVELSLFSQPERGRHVLSLLSFQAEQPPLPVDGISVRLRIPAKVAAVRELPGGATVPHRLDGDTLVIDAPRLETLALFALEHG
jgi:Hypothetical glycosyl hydrolase 6